MNANQESKDLTNIGAGVALGRVLDILEEACAQTHNNLIANIVVKEVQKKVLAMKILADHGQFVQRLPSCR